MRILRDTKSINHEIKENPDLAITDAEDLLSLVSLIHGRLVAGLRGPARHIGREFGVAHDIWRFSRDFETLLPAASGLAFVFQYDRLPLS